MMRTLLRKLEDLRPLVTPHKDESYQELLENIRRHGDICYPLVATEEGLIVDGCRRYAILKALGKSTAMVVIEDDLSEDQIWDLRAELNVLHRGPSPMEIRRFCGHPVSMDKESPSVSPELELLIQDILAAKGLGPRILQTIAGKTRIVLPDPNGPTDILEEVAKLADINRLFRPEGIR